MQPDDYPDDLIEGSGKMHPDQWKRMYQKAFNDREHAYRQLEDILYVFGTNTDEVDISQVSEYVRRVMPEFRRVPNDHLSLILQTVGTPVMAIEAIISELSTLLTSWRLTIPDPLLDPHQVPVKLLPPGQSWAWMGACFSPHWEAVGAGVVIDE